MSGLTLNTKKLGEIYEEWRGNKSCYDNGRPVFEADELLDFAQYCLMHGANGVNASENTLPIDSVSNLLNADNAPTFNEWLTKYFKPAKISKTYKDKVKGSEHTERFLYRKYARAYKLSI